MANIVVTDPLCDHGTVTRPISGDDGDGLLERGETWHFSCTHLVSPADPPIRSRIPPSAATATKARSDSDNHLVGIV